MSDRFPRLRKFAVGYFFPREDCDFVEIVKPYLPAVAEVYFPVPGVATARENRSDKTEAQQMQKLLEDLKWFRQNGVKLDMLINASCYGKKAVSLEWNTTLRRCLEFLDENGVKPEVVTTLSPFVATMVKRRFPDIDIRASVNMKIGSLTAMEYVADTFDSFYINRDLQRDLPTLRRISQWCADNGKKLCMLANSGCLRYCPVQSFHESLLAHDFQDMIGQSAFLDFNPTLCQTIFYKKKQYEELLRATWVRPEDLHYYDQHVEIFKLSTREAINPKAILEGYTSGKWDGNLLDPGFMDAFTGKMIQNRNFPADWIESGIAGICANNCTHCGKCTDLLNRILVEDPGYRPSSLQSFSMGKVSAGKFSLNF